MKTIEKYIKDIEVIEQNAFPFLSESVRNEASKRAQNIKTSLQQSSYIKVPFVGEFNASKSSLLNAYMGVNLLPTNITPETAVSYELYYSANESLEVWTYDILKQTNSLDKINELQVKPGDIVKLYINNEKIRSLNQRGIVLVDMPGIDSGIEEHNNAILNYIQEGTFFVIVSDIQHGTLTSSTIQFIRELKKYAISSAILLSKIDRKPEAEVKDVLATIKSFADRAIGTGVFVGAVSALSNQISDMEHLLDSLDGEDFAQQKFQTLVDGFVNHQIAQLEFQINLLSSPLTDFETQISALEQKREDAFRRLQENDSQAQPVEDSVQDILNDIRSALLTNSYMLANSIYSNNDAKSLNNQVLTIVRPVLINSFKREIGEYQEVIGQTIEQLADDIESVLKDANNPLIKQAEDIVGNLVGREVLEEFLTKGLQALLTRFAGYKAISGLLGILGKIINPLVGILIGLIPDLLRLIFGKGKDQKIEELQRKLEFEAFGKIIDSMREPITEMILDQRQESYNNLKKVIYEEIDSLNASLAEIKEKKNADQAKNNQMIESIKQSINTIKSQL